MFEPDGRNSIQYVGHLTARVVRGFFFILGLIIITPLAIFIWCRGTARAQAEDVRLWSAMPAQYVVVDFNAPDVEVQDVLQTARRITRRALYPTMKTQSGLAPELQSFPAGLSPAGEQPVGLFQIATRWQASRNLVPYFWYNLPVAEGVIDDLDRESSALVRVGEINFETKDPWDLKGVWNMAPDRNWDWGSGELYLRAKATANYAAYVRATEVIARLRTWALGRSVGCDLSSDLSGSNNYWLVPAKAILFLAAPQVMAEDLEGQERALTPRYAALTDRYNHLFSGDLPVVTMKLQVLDATALAKANPYSRLFRPQGSGTTTEADDFCGLKTRAGLGPFITGMSTGTSYDPGSDPEWLWSDFFLHHDPAVAPGSAEAQRALKAVCCVSDWRPRLHQLGLDDPASLAQVQSILDYVSRSTGASKRLAKTDGHHHYNWDANSFNPLRHDLDSYNPHNR